MRTAWASSRSGSRASEPLGRDAGRREVAVRAGADRATIGQRVLVAIGQALALGREAVVPEALGQVAAIQRDRALRRCSAGSSEQRSKCERHRGSRPPPGADPAISASASRIGVRVDADGGQAPGAPGRAPGAAGPWRSAVESGHRSAAMASRVRGRRVSASSVNRAWAWRPRSRTLPAVGRPDVEGDRAARCAGAGAAGEIVSDTASLVVVAASGPSPRWAGRRDAIGAAPRPADRHPPRPVARPHAQPTGLTTIVSPGAPAERRPTRQPRCRPADTHAPAGYTAADRADRRHHVRVRPPRPTCPATSSCAGRRSRWPRSSRAALRRGRRRSPRRDGLRADDLLFDRRRRRARARSSAAGSATSLVHPEAFAARPGALARPGDRRAGARRSAVVGGIAHRRRTSPACSGPRSGAGRTSWPLPLLVALGAGKLTMVLGGTRPGPAVRWPTWATAYLGPGPVGLAGAGPAVASVAGVRGHRDAGRRRSCLTVVVLGSAAFGRARRPAAARRRRPAGRSSRAVVSTDLARPGRRPARLQRRLAGSPSPSAVGVRSSWRGRAGRSAATAPPRPAATRADEPGWPDPEARPRF